jgi:hypothetical protein
MRPETVVTIEIPKRNLHIPLTYCISNSSEPAAAGCRTVYFTVASCITVKRLLRFPFFKKEQMWTGAM